MDTHDVFAIGDSARIVALDLRPDLANSAQIAVEQREFVARAILADVKRQPVRPYQPRGRGIVIMLGHRSAAAQVGRFAPLCCVAPRPKQDPTIEHLWKLGGARLVARHLSSTFLPLVAPRLVDRHTLARDAPPRRIPERGRVQLHSLQESSAVTII